MSELELRDTPARAIFRQMSDALGHIDPADIAAAQHVLRFSKKLLGTFADEFALRGLSPSRYAALMALHARDVALAPSEIADRLGVTRATVTGLIGGLVNDGLVAYADADADDRRRKAVALTDKGRALLREVVPDIFTQMAGLLAPLSGEERAILLQLMSKVETALDRAPAPEPGEE